MRFLARTTIKRTIRVRELSKAMVTHLHPALVAVLFGIAVWLRRRREPAWSRGRRMRAAARGVGQRPTFRQARLWQDDIGSAAGAADESP